jgi:hypothetical protein
LTTLYASIDTQEEKKDSYNKYESKDSYKVSTGVEGLPLRTSAYAPPA